MGAPPLRSVFVNTQGVRSQKSVVKAICWIEGRRAVCINYDSLQASGDLISPNAVNTTSYAEKRTGGL